MVAIELDIQSYIPNLHEVPLPEKVPVEISLVPFILSEKEKDTLRAIYIQVSFHGVDLKAEGERILQRATEAGIPHPTVESLLLLKHFVHPKSQEQSY